MKNLWSIFVFIITMFTFIFMYIAYKEWELNRKHHVDRIVSINKISSQTTISSLNYQESTLKLLGKNLLNINAYNNPVFGKPIIKEMLHINQGLLAIAMVSYSGQILYLSNAKRGQKLPNLVNNEFTKKSFLKDRNATRMQISRPYMLKTTMQWGIPIRVAIKNRHGEIPIVLASAIKMNGEKTPLNIEKLPKYINIKLIREDGYIQFQRPLKEKYFEKTYSKKIAFDFLEKVKKDTLFFEDKNYIYSSNYIKEYKLYNVVSIPKSVVYSPFLSKFYIGVLFLIFLIVVMFFIFKKVILIQENSKKDLEYLARHDLLTSLPNRLALQEELKKRMEKIKRRCFYLLFLDLDNFNYVNDTYGHHFGDEVLKAVSNRLKTLLKKDDFLSRQSGDEFIILINEKQKESIKKICIKILKALEEGFNIHGNDIYLAGSIGVSKFQNRHENISDLLNYADIALYKAKERKNSYIFFTSEIYKESKQYLQIESQLRLAIKNNEFFVVYQPKISSSSLKVVGVEALVRWNSSFLGFVSPEIFIPIAEKAGLINDIGEIVIKKAFEDMKKVYKICNKEFKLSINISARQLSTLKDIIKFKNIIFKSDFPKKNLILEVTESAFIDDTNRVIELLHEFRKKNIGISLDDFGTGYSSLNILSKIPLTELKIDKSFVQSMLNDEDNLMLVKSIINIGKSMNLQIVAEGVETKEELQILNEELCQIYQGYYFSKPLKKDELIEFIKKI